MNPRFVTKRPTKVSTEVPTKVSTQVVEVHLSCFHLFCSSTIIFVPAEQGQSQAEVDAADLPRLHGLPVRIAAQKWKSTGLLSLLFFFSLSLAQIR